MQAMVTLTSEESKRLIAKAVSRMEAVKKAREEGFIGFSLCTSAGYVIQELLGVDKIDPSGYCCGFIYSGGSCSVKKAHREKLLLLEKGRPRWLNFPEEDLTVAISAMDKDDIIIKSGNVMDPNGNVGVLLASPDGGEAGAYLPHIMAKGIRLIVPMTLNKTVPVPLTRILSCMGISKFRKDRVTGMACGMLPLDGLVVTETDAFRYLFGVTAVPVAMGGIGSGNGTVSLVLTGDDHHVESAWQAVNEIKGEPRLKNYLSNCNDCENARGEPGSAVCSTRLKG
ncbi:MAG: hypothetical protein JRJ04_08895 [Deltaproteobacteria bacterium]|nr:hypothetical protein [Deltaproteobacteria bacterium]